MINIQVEPFVNIVDALAEDRILTDEERALILDELTTDPAARDYAKMSNFEKCVALAMPYQVANPEVRQVVEKRSLRDIDGVVLQILVDNNLATLAEFETVTKELDPLWQPVIDMPSRLEALGFGPGAILTLRDITEALK